MQGTATPATKTTGRPLPKQAESQSKRDAKRKDCAPFPLCVFALKTSPRRLQARSGRTPSFLGRVRPKVVI